MIWLLRLFSALALAGFAAAVWFAGPLIRFAGERPLDPVWLRALIIGVVVGTVGIVYAVRLWRKRKARKALEAAMAAAEDDGSDGKVLEARMNEAIATLRQASGKRNFLYDVPWYIVIGPPGAGKTTALVNSGLNFPLAGSGQAQPVAGVGGTRNCDWWFTDEAVLIDTAGRYTTQESNQRTDAKSWLAFLSLLKRHRTRQPINGVILAISLAELMADGDQTGRIAEIRSRLQEIHDVLKVRFPVYVLFTKADLVSGFMETFGTFDEARRHKVWGATFQTEERGLNMTAEAPAEFDALVKRLTAEMGERLQAQTDPVARIAIFGFAAQLGALKGRIVHFLDGVFEPARRQVNAPMRGFYFSSGTQEGTPIDQLLGSIGRSFGKSADPHLSGGGKSFFLHDLLSRVIFAESGWVSHDKAADRRMMIARYAGLGAIAAAAIAALGVLGLSFAENKSLVAATNDAAGQYRDTAAPLLASATVSDADLETVIGALDALRGLPAGYDTKDQPTPAQATFGLSQRERILSASETAYRQGLERMFRSRLLFQLERTMEAKMADPMALYEPLKIYLMLGGKAPKVDDELIVTWLKRDWELNRYPGAHNREGRAQLEKHLRAMLALDDDQNPSFELNRSLVESAQRSLGRMSLADRATALIQSATYAAELPEFSLSSQAGPEAPVLFESDDGTDLASLRVPGLYTHAGFDFYMSALSKIAQALVDDQWVIGSSGEQGGFDQELLKLGPELLDRYGKGFGAAWNEALDKLKFKAMAADKPQYLALSAAGSPTSPVMQLFEAIARETALTQGRDAATQESDETTAARAKGLARIGIALASRKSQSRAGTAFVSTQNQDPGASIEAQFRSFQTLVAGAPGQRPIDALTQNFREIYQSVRLAADVPAQTDQVNANLQLQISTLRANASRLPKALARMARAAADDFEGTAAETSTAHLNEMLEQTIGHPCDEAIAGRFPFVATGADDVAMADFAKFFAPGGVLDRFFAQNLASLVDMSGQDWDWKQDTKMGRTLAKSTLKDFQLAAQIRAAFFPLGGPAPSINFTFTPLSLHGDADTALLNIDGQVLQATQAGNTPGLIPWPGKTGAASLTLTPELPGRESAIKFEGPWALKRLLDKGQVTVNGDTLEAHFVIGGRDVAYTIKTGEDGNPFTLPALSAFSCPKAF